MLKTHSSLNLNLGTIEEDGDEEEDEDYADDDVSQLSMDEYSFDTVTTAHQSTVYKNKKISKEMSAIHGEHFDPPKPKHRIHGNTKLGLPYLVDLWRDCLSRARISVQVQLLSGRDAYKKVFTRISTDAKELVLTLPMSPYMARSDLAFNSFVLSERAIPQEEMKYLLVLLKHHPKCAARMVAVSKVKGRSFTDGFFYEQRIRLPRKVDHKFAATTDGDELFFGKKFIEYPDGSVFLHVELIGETKDNYMPEERMLDPKLMKSVRKTMNADAMETEPTTGARVLQDHEEESKQPTNKRLRENDIAVETVTEESDEDDAMSNVSNFTSPPDAMAAAAAAAEAEAEAKAFQELARNTGTSVLEQADQRVKSSLAAALEKEATENE